MNHDLASQLLIDYVHGALEPADDAAVYEHVEHCDPCRAQLADELALTELLRRQAQLEERDLPAGVSATIWERVRAAQPSVGARIASWLRPAFAVPVAAAIALAAYFGVTYLGPHGAPSIEAAYYLQDHAALNNTVPFSGQQIAAEAEPAAYTADASQ